MPRTSRKLGNSRRRTSGQRYERLLKSLEARGAYDPRALAAAIGRRKYGKAQFQKLAAAGRRRKSSLRMNAAFRITEKQFWTYRALRRTGAMDFPWKQSESDLEKIQQSGMNHEQYNALWNLAYLINGAKSADEFNRLLAGGEITVTRGRKRIKTRASDKHINAVIAAFTSERLP